MIDSSDAARALGRIKTPAKAAAARKNSRDSAAKRSKTPAEMGCNCPARDSEKWQDHPTSCPARKLLYSRQRWRDLHPPAD